MPPIAIADGFDYKGGKPLDARIKYATTSAMKSVPDANLYDGCMAYCVATDKYYKWLSSNTVDTDLGKWREFEAGGGGETYTAGDGINIDENNEISTDNLQEGDIADCLYPLPSPEPGVSSLGGLTDVVLTSPEEGNALIYDDTLRKWVNGQGGKVYTAGDGINIDANDQISTDNLQSGDMDDVLDTLPGIKARYQLYSTVEHVIGTWINGKPLYEVTIEFGALPNNTSKLVSTGVSNIDIVVKIDAVAISTVNQNTNPIPSGAFGTLSYERCITYDKAQNSIYIKCGYDRSSENGYVTIAYTKTTD